MMKVGTKSLLFGVHQVFIHPVFVLWGWYKLNGRPNWKELICIIIHDWGYWGCSDMDGEDGGGHPKWAADKVYLWWDLKERRSGETLRYRRLCLLHSRFYAKETRLKPSKLCWADKLGTCLMPYWLWFLLGTLSGEIKEYLDTEMQKDKTLKKVSTPREFFKVYRDKVVPDLLREHGIIK